MSFLKNKISAASTNELTTNPKNVIPAEITKALSVVQNFLPLIIEQFFGQTIPQASGTLGEIQSISRLIPEVIKKLDQIVSDQKLIAENQELIAKEMEKNKNFSLELKKQVQTIQTQTFRLTNGKGNKSAYQTETIEEGEITND